MLSRSTPAYLARTMRPLLDGTDGRKYTLNMLSPSLVNSTCKGSVPAPFAVGAALHACSFVMTVLGPRQTAAHP